MADLIEESCSSSDRGFPNRTIDVGSIVEQFTGTAVNLKNAVPSNTECRGDQPRGD